MNGTTIGPYRLVAELGAGGMGKVWRAELTRRAAGLDVGAVVAVKIVHAHMLETEGFFKRFLREADVGKAVVHPNVVRTYDADAIASDGSQQHFLVMEYVEGQTLRELLAECERVPEELCRHIGREVAKGLAAIHAAGAVHRDLKPENVLITKEQVVKVMDLGVARLADEAVRLSQSGAFVGSLQYAAPEQFRPSGGIDGRADLYALGLILHELSTGVPAVCGEDFSSVVFSVLNEAPRRVGELNPQLSPFFEEVVARLLAKPREERFQFAEELVHVLEAGEQSTWWRGRAVDLREATKRPLRRIRIQRETALYGREAELAKVGSLYDRAAAGDGQVLLIDGEAGIGKSRLISEFVDALVQQGHDVNFLFGSYPPGGAATAAGAFSTAFREQFGDAGLEAALGERLTQTPLLVPAFAALLRGDTTPPGAQPLTRDSVQTVFVHTMRSLAAERPTIVLIDDLHFAPDEGRALFASLAFGVPGHRVLLVGTTRPGLPETWAANLERMGGFTRMPLTRLGPKDLTRLLVDALRSAGAAEEIGFQIAAKSDGNPFFVFEILRGLREGNFLAQRADGSWSTTRVVREISIPSSVRELVQARMAGLSEDDRNLLDVASCCGFEFDPLLVGAALSMPQIPVMRRLAQIEKAHRLVRSSGRRFVFDHHQVQEALYDGLPELLREPYHAAIAEAMEARHDARSKDPKSLDGALCVDLAEHFVKGARGDRALAYLEPALAHLAKGHLLAAAVTLGRRALDAPGLLTGSRRLDVLMGVARSLQGIGRFDDVVRLLNEARSLAESLGDFRRLREVLFNLGWALTRAVGAAEGMPLLEQSLALARSQGDRLSEAAALGNMGLAATSVGAIARALELQEEQIRICVAEGARRAEGVACGNVSLALVQAGRAQEAIAMNQRCIRIAEELGDVSMEVLAHGNIGWALGTLGRHEEAYVENLRQLELARALGFRGAEGYAAYLLANATRSLGRFVESDLWAARALTVAREIDDLVLLVNAEGSVALGAALAGNLAEALAAHMRVLPDIRRRGDRRSEVGALTNVGSYQTALGDFESARRTFEAARATDTHVLLPHDFGYVLHGLGWLAYHEGDLDAARRLCEEGLRVRRDIGEEDLAGESLAGLGAIEIAAGRPDVARQRVSEAVAIAERLSIADVAVLSRCMLAALDSAEIPAALAAFTAHESGVGFANRLESRVWLWRATNDVVHLREAKRLLDHLVAHAPPECQVSVLTNVPMHREIVDAARSHGVGTAEV